MKKSVLCGFGWRHLAIAVAFGLIVPLIAVVYSLSIGAKLQWLLLLEDAVTCFALGLAALLSVVSVDNLFGARLGPGPRLALAVAVGALLGTALMETASRLVLQPLGVAEGDSMRGLFLNEVHRTAFRLAGAVTWSLLVVVLYALFEERRRATGDLHAARVAALAAERKVVEGELRAMQARVDPDALFDSLLGVERAYAASTAAGEKALDTLIASLRKASLPA
jgi:hypothetical protein